VGVKAGPLGGAFGGPPGIDSDIQISTATIVISTSGQKMTRGAAIRLARSRTKPFSPRRSSSSRPK
jgi:hypothetical protein